MIVGRWLYCWMHCVECELAKEPTLPFLDQFQLKTLRAATRHLSSRDINSYLALRASLLSRTIGFEAKFQKDFSQFFRLNSSGLTDEFKAHYFKLLFSFAKSQEADPYSSILRELYKFERRKGDKSLQCSFVSKLVAIHDDDRPVFDIYVQNFFGIGVPRSIDVDFRIAGFVRNLEVIRAAYHAWQDDTSYQAVIRDACSQHPLLSQCSSVKVADFLVWTAGRSSKGNKRPDGSNF